MQQNRRMGKTECAAAVTWRRRTHECTVILGNPRVCMVFRIFRALNPKPLAHPGPGLPQPLPPHMLNEKGTGMEVMLTGTMDGASIWDPCMPPYPVPDSSPSLPASGAPCCGCCGCCCCCCCTASLRFAIRLPSMGSKSCLRDSKVGTGGCQHQRGR